MLIIAVLCMIPAINYGIIGIGLVAAGLFIAYYTRSTLAAILGSVSLVCAMLVFLSESPVFLAISIIGVVLSWSMTFKNAN